MPSQSHKAISPSLVSVIIPVYNCEPYLDKALDSIANQTYQNLEVIAIDDGSQDGSWGILQKFAAKDKRFRVSQNPTNQKIVATLNRAIAESQGTYLARMDGDDVREPDSIEKQVAYLQAHPQTVIVGGAINVCDEDLNVTNVRQYPQTDTQIRSKIFRYNPFAHPAVVMRSSALEQNPYRSDWAEDYDLWFRLGAVGKMANLSSVVLNLRTHAQSVSQSKLAYQEKLTLYLRLKAVFEYGYRMSAGDKLYFAVQLITSYMMPARFRFWLFNKLRSGLMK